MSIDLGNPTPSDTHSIVEVFKEFYRAFDASKLDDIGNVYSDDIIFRDPIHQITGIHTLHSYMSDMCSNVRYCQFEYLDQLIGKHSAYIKWHMHFAHTKLGAQIITVRGITHIEFDKKIHFHEDIYDLGQMLYEHIPLLGSATRFLKHRLATTTGH